MVVILADLALENDPFAGVTGHAHNTQFQAVFGPSVAR
jgi:hypothetical protein